MFTTASGYHSARPFVVVTVVCLLMGCGAVVQPTVASGLDMPDGSPPGPIFAWGNVSYGQCNVPPPNDDFVGLDGGAWHSLGLRSDGSISAWGDNSSGECSVPSPNAGFVAVAAGYGHSLGLKSDGSVVGWGYDDHGSCTPPAPNSDFVAIAAGSWFSLGLKADSSIVGWGYNASGQCSVPSPNEGFVAVAAGEDHGLGLRSDGSIVAWGANDYGQCTVPSPNSGFVAISGGHGLSLALRAHGSIAAWGDNRWGQCEVPSPNAGFLKVAAGWYHGLGLRPDGSLVAWGYNGDGQCNVPPGTYVAIVGGGFHSLGRGGAMGGQAQPFAGGGSPNDVAADPSMCWSDPPDLGGLIGSSEVISSLNLESEVANDFFAQAGSNIRLARWWGGYFNYSPGDPHVSGFTLRVFDDVGSSPGTLVASFDLQGAAAESLVYNQGEHPIYRYEACIDFSPPATGVYWFEVQASDHPFSPQWGRVASSSVHGAPSMFRSTHFGFPNWTQAGLVFGQSYDASQEFRCGTCEQAPPDSACVPATWSQVAVAGPPPRYAHAMCTNMNSGITVLFGGEAAGGDFLGDTWEWDGFLWTQVSPQQHPSAREYHAMSYDFFRDRIVLFGGQDGAGLNGDTWEWDGANWTMVAATGPSPRMGHAMSYDSDRRVTVLFGGDDGAERDDTWEWDGVSWTQRQPTGNPGARRFTAMAFDMGRGRTFLSGGQTGGLSLNDTWVWDGSDWDQVPVNGSVWPSARILSAVAYGQDCNSVVMFGGYPDAGTDPGTWAWNGAYWIQVPGGPTPRAGHAMAYDMQHDKVMVFGGYDLSQPGVTPLGDTWEWCSPCDTPLAMTDAQGEVILPACVDPDYPVTEEEIHEDRGLVSDLYPGYDTSTTEWYNEFPCDMSMGGEDDPEDEDEDLSEIFASLGSDLTPEAFQDSLTSVSERTLRKVLRTPPFRDPQATGLPYVYPSPPHCPDPNFQYCLGGRDIVFIHGYRLDPLKDRVLGINDSASVQWQTPTRFPGSIENPDFYSGYWKKGAERYWRKHIERYLTQKNYHNRYLVVSWPVTERLDVGIQAVLTQINDAMQYGIGVVDPTGHNDCSDFGTPSFVMVTHSTGGLLASAAMTAAVSHPDLNARHIAELAKAHIGFNGAFGGSNNATALLAAATLAPSPDALIICYFARLLLDADCHGIEWGRLFSSVTVDLVPIVTRTVWGGYLGASPVRTVTLGGGHPTTFGGNQDNWSWTAAQVSKRLLHLGLDDAVVTLTSASANPSQGPGAYQYFGRRREVKDMVMRLQGQTNRKHWYFGDQWRDTKWRIFDGVPGKLVTIGAEDYLSPWGMIQPRHVRPGGQFDPLARYYNHFSFMEAASDHFGSTPGWNEPWNGNRYENSPPDSWEPNKEETVVVNSGRALYTSYNLLHYDDSAPLLASHVPVKETFDGKLRRYRKKIRNNPPSSPTSGYKWFRTYHRAVGWEDKMLGDYAYEYLLTIPPEDPCPPASCCTNPPAGLIAWWPGDQGAEPGFDLVSPNATGYLMGSASIAAAQVGTGFVFANDGDHVQVPHQPKLDLGNAFTIHCWVLANDTASQNATILSKWAPAGTGYWLQMSNGHPRMVLQDTEAAWAWEGTSALIADNCWHHLAVTLGPGGLRIYVDGAEYLSSGPIALGPITNSEPLRIGWEPSEPSSGFKGLIDEVCLLTRDVGSSEILAAVRAGSSGMCRESVQITPIAQCGFSGQAQVSARICNYTATDAHYMWSISPLPAGGSCSLNGPSGINPNAGGVPVPRGTCADIGPIGVTCPGGGLPWARSCFELAVQREGQNPGVCAMAAKGAVIRGLGMWDIYPRDGFSQVDVSGVDLTGTTTATFELVFHAGLTDGLDYMVTVVPADGDTAGMPDIRLNGLPPGVPYYGTAFANPGEPDSIVVTVEALGGLGGRAYHVLLSYAMGGEGMEAGAAVVLYDSSEMNPAEVEAALPAYESLGWLDAHPNPFDDRLSIDFALRSGGDAEVTIYDLAGRRVRDLTESGLRSGLQRITWDGLDAQRRPVPLGMYFVEVRAEDRAIRRKVMVMRGR